jgi:hypothetical protein
MIQEGINMKDSFERYLIEQGYKVTIPAGNPSTVYDYIKRIDKVCDWENMTWSELANNIGKIVAEYDVGGSKEDYGRKSHNAVINALRRFYEFVDKQ